MTAPRVGAYYLVRHRSMSNLYAYTGRNTVVYGAAHLQRVEDPSLTAIDHSDMTGFMEAVQGLAGTDLDLIIHSPGGSIEAAESIGEYLSQSFDHIRVIVPHMAMSAATILSLVADEIHMATHSQLGPIDPQFILQTAFGYRWVPAQAILAQFEEAREASLRDPNEYTVWADMLRQYGPGLLVECRNASVLSASVVERWLNRYMFKGLSDATRSQHSENVARYFADHTIHFTHARGIFLGELQNFDGNLAIMDLESDPQLHELVLTVHYSLMHTFSNTRAAKIIENHAGSSYVVLSPYDG